MTLDFERAKIKDALGREFDDDLSGFLNWYMHQHNELLPAVPAKDGIMFYDGVHSVVLFRRAQWQVQLFTIVPNFTIPAHAHPHVDSYEVFLHGIEFNHNGRVVLPMNLALRERRGLPFAHGAVLRVLPGEPHGGRSGPAGAAFLSVQSWPHKSTPSSIGHDWEGPTVGPLHEKMQKLTVTD